MIITRRTAIAGLGIVVLGLIVAISLRTEEGLDARTLYLALADQRYTYSAALHARADAVAAADAALGRDGRLPEHAQLRLDSALVEVDRQMGDVAGALRGVNVGTLARTDLLEPVLRQVEAERHSIQALRRSVRSGKLLLRTNSKPIDIMGLTMASIRERWGVRQRLWRGNPLTA